MNSPVIHESQMQEIELQAINAALNRVQAVIEFQLDGTVLHANENFLQAVGYTLDEVRGRHHSMFCDSAFAASEAYTQFWQRLRGGQYEHGEYKRLGKGGQAPPESQNLIQRNAASVHPVETLGSGPAPDRRGVGEKIRR